MKDNEDISISQVISIVVHMKIVFHALDVSSDHYAVPQQ
jgi:hypothetical protein